MAEIKNHHLVTIIEKVDTDRKIQIKKEENADLRMEKAGIHNQEQAIRVNITRVGRAVMALPPPILP